jgi:hypothetical protein
MEDERSADELFTKEEIYEEEIIEEESIDEEEVVSLDDLLQEKLERIAMLE